MKTPGPKWITTNSETVCMGFNTMADAEIFLRRQSNNPGWLAKWALKFAKPYDVLEVHAYADVVGTTIHFQ